MPDLSRLKIVVDDSANLEKTLKQLGQTRVAVGIPSDDDRSAGSGSNARQAGTSITNAVLGYLFETGSPATNMPARPWLSPGVKGSMARWVSFLRQAGEAAVSGDAAGMDKAFNAAGLTAVSAVKARIQSNIPPPLKPATIRGRFRRRGLPTPPDAASQVTALIDTGQWINSITYVLRKPKK